MIRRLILIGAAVAMPIGLIAGTSGDAGAKTVTVPVGSATATCTGLSGTVKFKPSLTLAGGTASAQSSSIKSSLSGCTSSAVTGTFTGTVSGTLTNSSSTHSCTGLLGASPDTGTLTIKWKAPSGYKFSPATTSVNVTSVTGGTVTYSGDTYGEFTIPGAPDNSSSGAFTGGNSGADSTTSASTYPEDESSLTTTCESKKGLKSVDVSSTGVPSPAVTLN